MRVNPGKYGPLGKTNQPKISLIAPTQKPALGPKMKPDKIIGKATNLKKPCIIGGAGRALRARVMAIKAAI